jgi:hypothetical protein
MGPFFLGIEAFGAFGTGPSPTFGGGADLGLLYRSFSVELDARVVASSSVEASPGKIGTWQGMLSLAPCALVRFLSVCGVGTLGVLRAHGQGFTLSENSTVPFFTVAARGAAERAFGGRWWVRASAEIGSPIVRAQLLLDGLPVWMTPRVSVITGVAGGAFF